VSPKELLGGTPQDNAKIILDILRGSRGPKRDIILMNAAPALVACNKAPSLKTAFEEAGRVLDSGAPFEKLEELISYTKAVAA
jgi:anthranilate phosphoribosyltransferase